MQQQRRYDVIARQVVHSSPGACVVLLDPDLRIRAVSRPYERVALREHGELRGQFLFDAFRDNPDDPQASGTSNLAASLECTLRNRRTHTMRVQRYDIRDPAAPDRFLPKVWSPVNFPLLDHGELVGVVHRVEELSESRQVLAEIARAVDAGQSWTSAELLHTMAAITAVEDERHLDRQRALTLENEQLRRAIETRDTIGQAKGMLMERFDIDAVAAFALLSKLSQDTNTRLEEIARRLVRLDHPPASG